jgi:hypothetical protein
MSPKQYAKTFGKVLREEKADPMNMDKKNAKIMTLMTDYDFEKRRVG